MAAAATAILLAHLAWILLVIFGALWTRGRPGWTALHIAALVWGIAVEAGPWPCPLTLAEQYFEARAGAGAWHGDFLLHLLDQVVYPNVPGWLITVVGVAICVLNLSIYLLRFLRWKQARQAGVKQTQAEPKRTLVASHRFFRFPRPRV